jgi:cation/acetate symporter
VSRFASDEASAPSRAQRSMVALAFAVAASANLPVIVVSIFWRRFNTAGAVAGLAVGLLASIGLILLGPSLMAVDPPTVTGAARHLIQAKAWFPLENPGIPSIFSVNLTIL